MIEVEHLIVAAGQKDIGPVSFAVPARGHVSLMGRTGCGKTSVLEAVAGLRRVLAGAVRLNGVDVTTLKPAERGVGYVPQDLALFPTMSVREHLAFGPTIHRWPRQEVEARVDELAGLLSIRHLLDRRPQGLSGGEAQRTALGRALAARPAVLLLDEPFSALDDSTRSEMIELMRAVRSATGVTALHVTHNRRDAEALSDDVLWMEDGRVSAVVRPVAGT
ncbi:MAG TPA: ATP-binding cassette domain-containing protein [Humisphaera sp.]